MKDFSGSEEKHGFHKTVLIVLETRPFSWKGKSTKNVVKGLSSSMQALNQIVLFLIPLACMSVIYFVPTC